jgi:hypothetical protein
VARVATISLCGTVVSILSLNSIPQLWLILSTTGLRFQSFHLAAAALLWFALRLAVLVSCFGAECLPLDLSLCIVQALLSRLHLVTALLQTGLRRVGASALASLVAISRAIERYVTKTLPQAVMAARQCIASAWIVQQLSFQLRTRVVSLCWKLTRTAFETSQLLDSVFIDLLFHTWTGFAFDSTLGFPGEGHKSKKVRC